MHKYLTTVITSTLPFQRKKELLLFLKKCAEKEHRVYFDRKHVELLKQISEVKIDFKASPLVFILAQTVWDACYGNNKYYYITDVTHNAVMGYVSDKALPEKGTNK